MRNWIFAWALLNDPTKSSVAGKVGVAPVLASPQHIGHGCTGGWVLAINAYSKYKDEAWTFIDYMLSKQTQTSLALHAGLIPSRHDVVTHHHVQAQVPYFKHIETILEQGKNRPTLTNYNQFTTIVQGAISAVLSNQSSAASALRDIQSQVTSLT
jgi:multiple sugar transport system substrate-binding protein